LHIILTASLIFTIFKEYNWYILLACPTGAVKPHSPIDHLYNLGLIPCVGMLEASCEVTMQVRLVDFNRVLQFPPTQKVTLALVSMRMITCFSQSLLNISI